MVAKCAHQLTWNFHCSGTALNYVDSVISAAVEDRKWAGVLGQRRALQVACPNSVSPPNFLCHISHCGMCYPMGPFDSEWCVQAEENEG